MREELFGWLLEFYVLGSGHAPLKISDREKHICVIIDCKLVYSNENHLSDNLTNLIMDAGNKVVP